jgi:hypothetical protein
MIVCRKPEFWFLAGPSLIVGPCIAFVTVWAFNAFHKRSLRFLLLLAGFAASALYVAMSFIVLTKNQRLHYWLHAGCFIALDFFFAIADLLKMQDSGFSAGYVIYDLLTLVIQMIYLPFWRVEVGFERKKNTNLVASCGYAAVLFVFGRFPILGWQLFGERFLPSEKQKKE